MATVPRFIGLQQPQKSTTTNPSNATCYYTLPKIHLHRLTKHDGDEGHSANCLIDSFSGQRRVGTTNPAAGPFSRTCWDAVGNV